MPDLSSHLVRMFAIFDRWQQRLSERWREGANRRTIVILLVLGAFSTYAYTAFIQPPDGFPLEKLVTIPSGSSLHDAAEALQEAQVVRSARLLSVIIILSGHQHDVHAGDYLFKEPRSVFTIARAVVFGQYGLEPIRIRIPEGATTKEMARIYDLRLERFNDQNFLAQAQLQEGYLFPDTYFFLPNATEDVVIRSMRQNFDEKVAPLAPLFASSTRSREDIIIMASILEREGNGKNDDRRHIASVLWNRIDRHMPLQVDAVFLYTIGKGTFQLTRKDLKSDSPYNTYVHVGLPPTPIGSPSLDSIVAALTPIESKDLFYLADRHGNTYFSKTYTEHARKKRLYVDTVR